ncbi:unnamed protein product [Boreogadus saida]
MSKTLALKDDLSKMTASLPDAIVKAIKMRFDPVLDSQEGLLAAATCPKFKLRWLRDERRREHVKELLIRECRKVAPAADNANVSSQLPASSAEIDFFDFENQPTESFSAEKERDHLQHRNPSPVSVMAVTEEHGEAGALSLPALAADEAATAPAADGGPVGRSQWRVQPPEEGRGRKRRRP